MEFVNPEDARAAIDNMHYAEIYGKAIRVSLAKPGSQLYKGITMPTSVPDGPPRASNHSLLIL